MITLEELEQRREERGLEIVNKDSQIRMIGGSVYQVLSQNGNGVYLVSLTDDGWVCECPDFKFRGLKCKHAWAVELSIKLREEVEKGIVIQQITITSTSAFSPVYTSLPIDPALFAIHFCFAEKLSCLTTVAIACYANVLTLFLLCADNIA